MHDQALSNAPELVSMDKPMPAISLEPATAGEVDPGERERNLVLAAQRGDTGAIRELYDSYRERIMALILYSVGDSLLAQDVLQTVFFKVFQGLPRFRFQSSLFTWIYRIARNECRNQHRRLSAPHVPLEAIVGSRDEIDPKPASTNHGVRPERDLILQRAVMQLPFKMREVILLKYLEGFSYEEISRALGCAPGTVASRLNRALLELRERLQPVRWLL